MPRFEFQKNKAVRFFWEISLGEGERSISTRFGKMGAEGDAQDMTRDFDTPHLAKKEFLRLVGAKKAEGYVEISPLSAGRATSNPALEAELEANPDDDTRYLVYADWLQSNGNPHGELIAVQHALRRALPGAPERTGLLAEQRRLLDENQAEFLGPAADKGDISVLWNLGYIRTATFTVDFRILDQVEGMLEDFLSLKTVRLLRDLTFDVSASYGEEIDFGDLVALLGKAKRTPALRAIAFSGTAPDDAPPEERAGRLWSSIGGLEEIRPADFPKLERLSLRGGALRLGKVAFPALKELTLEIDELSFDNLADLYGATWPSLERLTIWFERTMDSIYGQTNRVETILAGRCFPKLTHLGLLNFADADELAQALARSKLLPRLESLDLSFGALQDFGAEALLDAKPACAKLQSLDLSENLLTPAMCARIASLCPSVTARRQRQVYRRGGLDPEDPGVARRFDEIEE